MRVIISLFFCIDTYKNIETITIQNVYKMLTNVYKKHIIITEK